jgi:hypothetical protein
LRLRTTWSSTLSHSRTPHEGCGKDRDDARKISPPLRLHSLQVVGAMLLRVRAHVGSEALLRIRTTRHDSVDHPFALASDLCIPTLNIDRPRRKHADDIMLRHQRSCGCPPGLERPQSPRRSGGIQLSKRACLVEMYSGAIHGLHARHIVAGVQA